MEAQRADPLGTGDAVGPGGGHFPEPPGRMGAVSHVGLVSDLGSFFLGGGVVWGKGAGFRARRRPWDVTGALRVVCNDETPKKTHLWRGGAG